MRVREEDKDWMVYSKDEVFDRNIQEKPEEDVGKLFIVGFVAGMLAWLPLYCLFGWLHDAGLVPDWYINNPVFKGAFFWADVVFVLVAETLIALMLKPVDYELAIGFFVGAIIAPVIWLIVLPLLFSRGNEKLEGKEEENE